MRRVGLYCFGKHELQSAQNDESHNVLPRQNWRLCWTCTWMSLNTHIECNSRTSHSDNFDEHFKRIYLVTDSCSAEW